MTTRRALLGVAIAALGMPQAVRAQTVQACQNPATCAQVTVEGGSGTPGAIVPVKLTFMQAPNDGQTGGPDEIAALAMTLSMAPGGVGTPLTLADCTIGADDLPAAVHPDPSIANFKVVVENASCATCSKTSTRHCSVNSDCPADETCVGRTHCLCPDAGQPRDNFINLVVYGPNPLPTPGPNPVEIPIIPSGPPPFVTIDLKIAANASGSIPLHAYNQVEDASHPQFTALLSVGDTQAVDQTCLPVPGSPPCSSAGSQSQIAFADGSVAVGQACVGDCNIDQVVTVDELTLMVNIALENPGFSVTDCPAGDPNGDGMITIDEITTAVNNLLGVCAQ
jgi:hypothetical protein